VDTGLNTQIQLVCQTLRIMAGEGDLQVLLRMFTSRKVGMLVAMGHVKALQSKELRRYVTCSGRVARQSILDVLWLLSAD
jgi:hypothetical protein